MALFWTWCVRNPALALAAVGLLAGLFGVTGWPVALMAMATGAVVADSAQHLARSARRRSRRAKEASEAERAVREIRERYRERHGTHRNAA
jgi:hypothetical protein